MKLFVGLGNPGKKYQNTRHNVGWMVVDALASNITNVGTGSEFKFEKKFNADILRIGETILAKPMTFMNDSGVSVSALTTFYKILPTDLYIIHDDLDIPLGNYKIQKGKGPKGHNGILSVEEKLGTNDFWRVRVGIENRPEKAKMQMLNGEQQRVSGEVYTLLEFEKSERQDLDRVVKQIIEKLFA